MNRPPGQGYPYDEPTPVPVDDDAGHAREGLIPAIDPEAVGRFVRARVQCGFPTSDDGSTFCRNTAPCPIHRDLRAPRPGESMLEWIHADDTDIRDVADQVNHADPDAGELRDPAPGLYETLTGSALPSYVELRERYGDPDNLKPIPKYDPDSPLDLHDQLHADDQPWSVRSRLQASLGRRALATRLADALPPLLGAELADRLDTLITQALTEQQAAITQDISDRYHEARSRLEADAAQKLKEVHDERYRGHSRFS